MSDSPPPTVDITVKCPQCLRILDFTLVATGYDSVYAQCCVCEYMVKATLTLHSIRHGYFDEHPHERPSEVQRV